MQLKPPRPIGVTILAILSFLSANFFFFLAVLFIVFSLFVSALLVVLGILDFVFAAAYLSGSGWAWTLGVIFGLINIVGSAVEVGLGFTPPIIGMIVSIITVYYLTRPHVKVFFGRGSLKSSDSTLTSEDSIPTISSVARACKNCGATVPAGASFCRNCGTVQ